MESHTHTTSCEAAVEGIEIYAPGRRELLPTPTDYGVEGPFAKPWPLKAWLWLGAAVLSALGLFACVLFTAGALLRHFQLI